MPGIPPAIAQLIQSRQQPPNTQAPPNGQPQPQQAQPQQGGQGGSLMPGLQGIQGQVTIPLSLLMELVAAASLGQKEQRDQEASAQRQQTKDQIEMARAQTGVPPGGAAGAVPGAAAGGPINPAALQAMLQQASQLRQQGGGAPPVA